MTGCKKRTTTQLKVIEGVKLTGRERLLELLGLGGVVDDESVQVARATDLELGLVAGLLDAAGYVT